MPESAWKVLGISKELADLLEKDINRLSKKRRIMSYLKVDLESYDDLLKLVVYSNPERAIHFIFKHETTYFMYYGNTKEYYCAHDLNGPIPGVYRYKKMDLRSPERIENDLFTIEDYQLGDVYVCVLEVMDYEAW